LVADEVTPLGAIAASAAFGLVKGFGLGSTYRGPQQRNTLHAVLLGPAYEEMLYRVIPLHAARGRLPHGLTALPFALDHVIPESRYGLSFGQLVFRFVEVALGGYLYETAYRSGGYFAAVAAHSVHNLCATAGVNAGLAR